MAEVLFSAVTDGTQTQTRLLLQQADIVSDLQTKSSKQLEQQQDLMDELHRLKQHRKHLQQQVHELKTRKRMQTLQQRLILQARSSSSVGSTLPLPALASTAFTEQSQKRELSQVSNAYRFAGKSIFTASDNTVGLRIETFYDGKYHESYYVMLRQRIEDNQLEVASHTIPAFIPFAGIAKELLNADMNAFLDRLDDHLQAFVARREQAVTLQQKHGHRLVLVANVGLTYVQITVHTPDQCIIYLAYDDLCSVLPTRVSVIPEQPLNNRSSVVLRLHNKEHPFLSCDLLSAFSQTF